MHRVDAQDTEPGVEIGGTHTRPGHTWSSRSTGWILQFSINVSWNTLTLQRFKTQRLQRLGKRLSLNVGPQKTNPGVRFFCFLGDPGPRSEGTWAKEDKRRNHAKSSFVSSM